MTYIDLINSIGVEQYKKYVITHFDQIMAVYNLCGLCDINSITTSTNNEIMTFDIEFADVNHIPVVYNHLSIDNKLYIYDKVFIITPTQNNDNKVTITITPCA